MESDHFIPINQITQEGLGDSSARPMADDEDIVEGEYAQTYGGEEGIQAYVADNEVVDATDVELILTEEEEELLAKQKQRRIIAYVICAFVVVAAIVVPVSIVAGSDNGGSNTPSPTFSPTEQPSASPSSTPTDGGLPPFIQCLSDDVGLTSRDTFNDRGSSEWRALLWIVDEDNYVQQEGIECPEQRFLERYTLATMYFQMDGENWSDCNRNNPECPFNRNQFGWLSNNDVCDWHQVDCIEGSVVGLNFGTYFGFATSFVWHKDMLSLMVNRSWCA